MWNNQGGFTNYGDQGGGGGFNSPGGFGTPSASQERKSQRSKVQSFVPCTVAQVYNATMADDKFYTADTEIAQITIIGLVRSVNQAATRLDYSIDDMTGPSIDVKQYVDNDDSVPDEEKTKVVRENTYVRVCGSIRSFQGKRIIVAFKMVPIVDMNELTCHLLEVINAHASMSKAANSKGDEKMDIGHYRSGVPLMSDDPGMQGFSDVQRQIHNIIKNNLTDEGASLDTIIAHLKGYPMKNVREAIEFLSSEGHIYSTIDDDHFKATDA